MFELMAISELLLTSKCQAVPFAAFVKKKVPSPHGLICQYVEPSDSVELHMLGTVPPGVVSVSEANTVIALSGPDALVRRT